MIQQKIKGKYMTKRQVPVEKNKTYTADIQDLSYEGLGVAKIDHYPIFIEGALVGETVDFKVTKVGRKFAFGRLISIEKAAPERVEVKGAAYTQTGTMPLQHMTYAAQLAFKKQQVVNNFNRMGYQDDFPIYDTIGMAEPYGYRNKAQIPVRDINGRLETGFYRKRSHELIPLEDFIIQDPKIDEAIVVIRDIMRKYDITAYDEEQLTGVLRHIMVRRGYYTNELMVVLVTNGAKLPHAAEIVADILQALPETVSIVQNINDKDTNVILGHRHKLLYGEDVYHDKLFDFTFEISHQSFYQINPTQTEKLYQTALDYANLTGDETVIDAYCGIGTLTLTLAQKAKKVYGIEIVSDAIKNAKNNARINAVNNVDFSVGAAEKVITDWAKEGKQADVIVVDPPRKGLAKDFLEAVITMQPQKMVYVSCNPATLARDASYLAEHGYQIEKAQPVDMFPQTTHVETVVLLSRVDK